MIPKSYAWSDWLTSVIKGLNYTGNLAIWVGTSSIYLVQCHRGPRNKPTKMLVNDTCFMRWSNASYSLGHDVSGVRE